MTRARWEPLIRGPAADAAWEVIDAIAQHLRTPSDDAGGAPGLDDGEAGRAVFFAYLAAATAATLDRDTAIAALDIAADGLGSCEFGDGFISGFTGVAWAIDHVERMLVPDDHDDDTNAEVDDWLRHRLATDGTVHFDLVSGLVGHAVYAIERCAAPELASAMAERLVARGHRVADGLTWFTPPAQLSEWERRNAPDGFFNLGLAHGVPGVIALLARAQTMGLGTAGLADALGDAVRWVLAQQLPDGSSASFPWYQAPGRTPQPARQAWCYGDPGVGAALVAAAVALGDASLHDTALDVLRRSIEHARTDELIADAGLCHGSAGLLHIYNRVHQATGDPACESAAREWFARTLAMRGTDGVAGFSPHATTDTPPTLRESRGLLCGAAGIGLALLAAVSPVIPRWDQILLLDLPPSDPT